MGISKPNSLLLLLLLFVVLASEKSSAVQARPLSSSQQSKDSKTQISITYIHAEEWVYTDEFVLIKLRVDFYGFFFVFCFCFLGYASVFATLGLVCKCCDGGECKSTWNNSCSKVQCLPWKQHYQWILFFSMFLSFILYIYMYACSTRYHGSGTFFFFFFFFGFFFWSPCLYTKDIKFESLGLSSGEWRRTIRYVQLMATSFEFLLFSMNFSDQGNYVIYYFKA